MEKEHGEAQKAPDAERAPNGVPAAGAADAKAPRSTAMPTLPARPGSRSAMPSLPSRPARPAAPASAEGGCTSPDLLRALLKPRLHVAHRLPQARPLRCVCPWTPTLCRYVQVHRRLRPVPAPHCPLAPHHLLSQRRQPRLLSPWRNPRMGSRSGRAAAPTWSGAGGKALQRLHRARHPTARRHPARRAPRLMAPRPMAAALHARQPSRPPMATQETAGTTAVRAPLQSTVVTCQRTGSEQVAVLSVAGSAVCSVACLQATRLARRRARRATSGARCWACTYSCCGLPYAWARTHAPASCSRLCTGELAAATPAMACWFPSQGAPWLSPTYPGGVSGVDLLQGVRMYMATIQQHWTGGFCEG